MANQCSANCGFCGRCSDGDGPDRIERICSDCGGIVLVDRSEEYVIHEQCDRCRGKTSTLFDLAADLARATLVPHERKAS